jgi:hypothetical protein
MTNTDLNRVKRAAAKAARLRAQAEAARREYHDAVRDANRSHSYSEIADALGVTRQRIHQILDTRREVVRIEHDISLDEGRQFSRVYERLISGQRKTHLEDGWVEHPTAVIVRFEAWS